MYSLPQEIEVWYIIPAIRKELARELTKEYNISYEKTGYFLGISKAAVSQYLSDKRANKIKLRKNTLDEIKKSAKLISEDLSSGFMEIQKILKFMKENKSSCEACKKYNKNVIKYCNAEPTYS